MRSWRRVVAGEVAASLSTGAAAAARPSRSRLLLWFGGARHRDLPAAEAQPTTDRALHRRYSGWRWCDETERAVMSDLGGAKMFKIE